MSVSLACCAVFSSPILIRRTFQVSGIIKAILLVTLANSLLASSNLQSLWTILENDFSILCGCLPHLKPLFRRFLGDTNDRSDPYYPSYEQHHSNAKSHGFRLSGVKTMVSGPANRASAVPPERRNSSEVELKGIEVHTTINREVSVRTRGADHGIGRASQSSTGLHDDV